MSDLVKAIRHVRELKSNLSAEVVIREATGHYETQLVYRSRWAEPGYFGEYELVWLYDSPGITKPDDFKRKFAEAELTKIYETSGRFVVKLGAARALGYSWGKILDAIVEPGNI